MREVVMFVLPSRGLLVDATQAIHKNSHVKIHHSAIITKAESGEATVYEDDINPDEGAIAGGTLGSVMGALGIAQLGAFLLPGIGPIIAIGAGALVGALVGGATGSLTASAIDLGINNQLLERLAQQLEADRVAVVVELEGSAEGLAQLEGQLKPFDAVLVQTSNP